MYHRQLQNRLSRGCSGEVLSHLNMRRHDVLVSLGTLSSAIDAFFTFVCCLLHVRVRSTEWTVNSSAVFARVESIRCILSMQLPHEPLRSHKQVNEPLFALHCSVS